MDNYREWQLRADLQMIQFFEESEGMALKPSSVYGTVNQISVHLHKLKAIETLDRSRKYIAIRGKRGVQTLTFHTPIEERDSGS